MDADARLIALAEAVADGLTPDWERESANASDNERAAIRQLQNIALAARPNAERAMQVTLSHRSSRAEAMGLAPDAVAPIAWGPLTVHEKIGSGRFGDVYRATDPGLERDVALKLLRHDSDADGRLVVQEGRLMARVRHPNVATIYGAQRIDGRTGLWMELVDGPALEAELAVRGPFDAADLARVGIELCRALDAVHRAGLVHRDVKAQNVLIEPGGRVVLGDFGTGQDLRDRADSTALVGTPAYLAPEALTGGADTPQRDIYSLGVLLFHLATGRYPIQARTLVEIRAAHARGVRTSLRDFRPDLPTCLVAAIDRALQPDPALRFADAASMEAALTPVPPAAAPRRATSVGWLVVVASLALVGTGAVWMSGLRDRGAPLTTNQGPAGSRAFRQISPDPALAGPGAPSPDGRLLSYVDDETGDLAVHEIATGRRWRVTRNAETPSSPGHAETSRFIDEGRRLLYLWFSPPADDGAQGDAEIRTIPVRGGEPTTIWRDPDRAHVRLHHWAGDDRLILVNRWIGDARSELAVVGTQDGSIRASVAVGRSSPNGASLSPDGSLVVFDRPDPETLLRDIHVAVVGAPGEAALIHDAASDHSPMWTRDGRFVLFLSDRSGPTGLWAQPMDGARPVGPPQRVEPNLGWAYPMGETSAGGYFFRRRIGTRDVQTVALDESGVVTGEPARASTEVIGNNGSSDWSPDGRSLTFFRRRDDRWSLVFKDLASGREREIVDPQMVGIGRPRWEADGRSILVKATYRDRVGVHRLDLQTGRVSMVLPRQIGHYELIPGRREILYNTRGRELSRYDVDTGRTVVAHHIEAPWFATGIAVSRDGLRVAYSASDGRGSSSLRVASLSSPEPAREIFVAPPGEYLEAYAFTPDGAQVLIKRARRTSGPLESDNSRVWAVDVESGQPRLVGLDIHGLNQMRLSPDGRQLSFDAGWPKQEVWVLEHFLESLVGR
jgi:Tol biopolymer transport system component